LMIGLVSQEHQAFEAAVLDDMRKLGANILHISEAGGEVAFQSGLSAGACNILCLPIGQLMAFERSIQKGLDPDHPHNLDAVVRLSV
jgi:glutamine---fructose-6-phosphate transaminase (isomerizing)